MWKVLALVSSVITRTLLWIGGCCKDWSSVVAHKSVYFVAGVLDILLRFAWLQLVLTLDVHSLQGITVSLIFSCLEIIRRGMWNFFRLENEHLNNVGRYRAFKSVPLPFTYYDDEEEDDDDIDKDE